MFLFIPLPASHWTPEITLDSACSCRSLFHPAKTTPSKANPPWDFWVHKRFSARWSSLWSSACRTWSTLQLFLLSQHLHDCACSRGKLPFPTGKDTGKKGNLCAFVQIYASTRTQASFPANPKRLRGCPPEHKLQQQQRRISRSWRWTGSGRFPFLSQNLSACLAFSGVTSFTGTFDTAPFTNGLHKMFYSPLENPSASRNGAAFQKCWILQKPNETQQTRRCFTPLEISDLLCLIKKWPDPKAYCP